MIGHAVVNVEMRLIPALIERRATVHVGKVALQVHRENPATNSSRA